MKFTAIDVETANPDLGSICQVGIARFENAVLVDEWSAIVDPKTYFDPVNVAVHGITPRMVKGKPKIADVADRIRDLLQGGITVCHTSFDRVAINRAFHRAGLPQPDTSWLDTARVARRAWPEFAWKGYGLASVCRKIGHDFKHHDALEDAKAAGQILLAVLRESQQDIGFWLQRIGQPIDPRSTNGPIHRDGNLEGSLYGEVVVFTGTLSLPRSRAADLAAQVGCRVEPNVTRNTTILVLGDQDASKLAGHEKSSKHRKAEHLVATGQQIRIITESDFRTFVMDDYGAGRSLREPV